jgi:hypothetical protein
MDYKMYISCPTEKKNLMEPNVDGERYCLQLQKALYGTKQAGFLWFKYIFYPKLKDWIMQLKSEPYVFLNVSGNFKYLCLFMLRILRFILALYRGLEV